jgi:hypothetical protein
MTPNTTTPERCTGPAHRSWRGAAALVAFLLAPPLRVEAAIFEVITTADSGAGSLREALAASESNAGPDEIFITATGVIELESALPRIGHDVTIVGPGADLLTITRAPDASPFRILLVVSEMAAANQVAISDVTISGGRAFSGGGIYAAVTSLTLERVVVRANAAEVGGGIVLDGLAGVTIRSAAIVDNVAAQGGGVALLATLATGDRLDLENSTVSGNEADEGGGLYAPYPETAVTIASATFADNAAERGASLFHAVGDVRLRSTILAPRSGSACHVHSPLDHPVVSQGHNLASDDSCALGGLGDQVADPSLEPLAPNGGTTPTHAIGVASPAHDQGAAGTLATDQRGLDRVHDDPAVANAEGGDGADVGAFELQPVAATPTIGSLIKDVVALGLSRGIERSLLAKLEGAQRGTDSGRLSATCGTLGAFAEEVSALAGEQVAPGDAAALLGDVDAVRDELGCAAG